MRFKHQSKTSQIPQINLLPLMDILATVLIFFVLISMTLTSEKAGTGVNIELPTTSQGASQVAGDGQAAQNLPDPLVVGLTKKGEILANDKAVTKEELSAKIQSYLQQTPEGAAILKADKTVPYEQVIQLLVYMKETGGDRVSLAIDER